MPPLLRDSGYVPPLVRRHAVTRFLWRRGVDYRTLERVARWLP